MIRFLHPVWLWLLWLLPLLALWRGRTGPVAAIEYSNASFAREAARATRSRAGRWLKALKLASLGLVIVALARPQLGHSSNTVKASGVDIMFALDVSGSMEAQDFKLRGQPADRIDVVKSIVSKFIEARPNDRIGLLAFAGAPYLVSPLTLDHDWLLQNLGRVRVGAIEDATAIGSAIAVGVNRLRDQPGKSKVLVLLTDGQNNAGRVTPQTAAEAAKALGVKVYTIGAGVRGQAPVPVTDAFGNRRLVIQTGDRSGFFQEARRALQERLGQRWNIPANTVTSSEIDQRLNGAGRPINTLFQLADRAAYAGIQLDASYLEQWKKYVTEQLSLLEAI